MVLNQNYILDKGLEGSEYLDITKSETFSVFPP